MIALMLLIITQVFILIIQHRHFKQYDLLIEDQQCEIEILKLELTAARQEIERMRK